MPFSSSHRAASRTFFGLALFSCAFLFYWNLSAQESPSDAASFPHGEKIQIPGIKNAGKINDHLFRGAQPAAPGYAELKKLGITTIVNLRSGHTQAIDWERQQAESNGMRFQNIAVGGFSSPSDQQLVQFLEIFRANPDEKVFVHCYYGDDRTGVFVASYRMAIDKWTAAQALHEMYYFGFNGRWQPVMKSFVRNFPARFDASPSFAGFKQEKTASPAAQSPQD